MRQALIYASRGWPWSSEEWNTSSRLAPEPGFWTTEPSALRSTLQCFLRINSHRQMCRSKGTHLVSSADSTTSSSARSPRHLFCRRKAAFAHCGHESLCFRVLFFPGHGHALDKHTNWNSQLVDAPGDGPHLWWVGSCFLAASLANKEACCILYLRVPRGHWAPVVPNGKWLHNTHFRPQTRFHTPSWCCLPPNPCRKAGLFRGEPKPNNRGELLAHKTGRSRGGAGFRRAVIQWPHEAIEDPVLASLRTASSLAPPFPLAK